MTDAAPLWLQQMRIITGTKEAPGSADNPAILAMADAIAQAYPDMAAYCDTYQHDETPWCGLAAGYCMAGSGIRPPFGSTDTDRFLWAQSWAYDPNYDLLPGPVLGCVVVMTRSGGGHVTFYESDAGGGYIKCRGGNQSDAVTVASYPKSGVIAYLWPRGVPLPEVPAADRPTLKKGSTGPYVVSVQTTLGIPADGDFGAVTDAAVRGYQAACGLAADGVVGSATWAALDALAARKMMGDRLPDDLIAAITQTAEASTIAAYNWKDRGKAPLGYTAGVACTFALALAWFENGRHDAEAMAQADRGDPNTDALSWYRAEFAAAGMDNSDCNADTLRHLFALMLGLGMRESSGEYCCGRDTSAGNTTSDSAEAGAHQTSWDIRSCSALIPPLLQEFWTNPNGFLPTFRSGVEPSASDLQNYGSGDGAKYQFLSKYAPAFHLMVTALGLRYRRQHWGPINRREAEVRRDADAMLAEVQDLVDGFEPTPGPEPEPVPDQPVVNIVIEAPPDVVVNIRHV